MKIKNVAGNLVVAVLCLVFVISVFYAVYEIRDYHTQYHPREDSFLYSLQEQQYAGMVEMMYRNEGAGVKTNSTYEECYAVARYYEAATYYKAYQMAGDDKSALEKQKIMEEQRQLMGELSYAAGDIDELLGIISEEK